MTFVVKAYQKYEDGRALRLAKKREDQKMKQEERKAKQEEESKETAKERFMNKFSQTIETDK